MKKYEQQKFIGERALFKSNNLQLSFCTFADGESPLKESSNLEIDHNLFQWKYPLWYCTDVRVTNSTLFETARSGIWYTKQITMKNTVIDAPKTFRRCEGISLEKVNMANAQETLWNCSDIKMKDVTAKGDYFGMNSRNIEIDNFTLSGNYAFDGGKNIVVRNAKLISKDAFWNCENVTVYDSVIYGEYLGWNSKNITFINCTIESEQGMCYMENLVLKNCKLLNTNLTFEYSTVDAEITSHIDSVKNPYGGSIVAKAIDEIIFDDPKVNPAATVIRCEKTEENIAI